MTAVSHHRRDDRGQVGIGVLVVFIAMVLVAGISAGVLIDTAGLLETRAEDTSRESTAQVTDRVRTVSVLANVTAEYDDRRAKNGADVMDNESVDVVRVTVMRAAGSGDVNLSRATIEWDGPNQATTLVHNGTAPHAPGKSPDTASFSTSGLSPVPGGGGGGGNTADEPHATFNTYSLNSNEHAVLTESKQRIHIYLNAAQISSGSRAATAPWDVKPLSPSSEVALSVVTAAGSTTTYRLSIPPTLDGETAVAL